jgi:hypothetical protein
MCRITNATLTEKACRLVFRQNLPETHRSKALVYKHFILVYQLPVVYGGFAAELGPRAA